MAEEKANGGGEWSPSSWRSKPVAQKVDYPDQKALDDAVNEIKRLPPLMSVAEIESLRKQLADVAVGKRFVLQGGDCAERFADCSAEDIDKKLKVMIMMSLVITWGARMPCVRIARMAGQFAKPRSKPTEIIDGVEYTSFRGDNVNGFDLTDRVPDPKRMVQGYFHSAATLNYARTRVSDGFSDIHNSKTWNVGFLSNSAKRAEYERVVEDVLVVGDAVDFAETCGVSSSGSLRTIDLFVGHEGLGLDYEESMTRLDPKTGKYFNMGAQFLWIGDRTRQLDHAHVEYFRGIANPIGIKVGPSMPPEDLVPLIRSLWSDPEGTPGKITLITRYGATKVSTLLPKHVEVVQQAGLKVVWQCDPCHGNTHMSESGYKTRDVDMILAEITKTFEVHNRMGSILGGVHIELTGENVTECVGGPENVTDQMLPQRYTTYCDPRLNYAQSLEVAFLLANKVAESKKLRAGHRSPPPTPSKSQTARPATGDPPASKKMKL